MSKRFTDTEIWNEDWFLSLSGEYMLLVKFIFEHCDHAGIWRKNYIKFKKLTGFEVELNGFLKQVNNDEERIIILENDNWFIKGFVQFQYFDKVKRFDLVLSNPLHRSIHASLQKNGVSEGSVRGLREVLADTKDKEKDKDIITIIRYLNERTNSKYREDTKKTRDLIRVRLKKFSVKDFKTVIDKKTNEWQDTEMGKYLRPETLFGTKFESYLNQKTVKEPVNPWADND
jgi:uncharacterized phage protein (TIGR02220 family)